MMDVRLSARAWIRFIRLVLVLVLVAPLLTVVQCSHIHIYVTVIVGSV